MPEPRIPAGDNGRRGFCRPCCKGGEPSFLPCRSLCAFACCALHVPRARLVHVGVMPACASPPPFRGVLVRKQHKNATEQGANFGASVQVGLPAASLKFLEWAFGEQCVVLKRVLGSWAFPLRRAPACARWALSLCACGGNAPACPPSAALRAWRPRPVPCGLTCLASNRTWRADPMPLWSAAPCRPRTRAFAASPVPQPAHRPWRQGRRSPARRCLGPDPRGLGRNRLVGPWVGGTRPARTRPPRATGTWCPADPLGRGPRPACGAPVPAGSHVSRAGPASGRRRRKGRAVTRFLGRCGRPEPDKLYSACAPRPRA